MPRKRKANSETRTVPAHTIAKPVNFATQRCPEKKTNEINLNSVALENVRPAQRDDCEMLVFSVSFFFRDPRITHLSTVHLFITLM